MTAATHTNDPTQESSLALPRPPILSSYNAGWEKFQLALYHLPAYRIPEHHAPYHTVCINYGVSAKVDLKMNGHSGTRYSVPSDICIFPANIWQTAEWHHEVAFMDLFLEPDLLTQTGVELCDRDQVELIPTLESFFDPLIYQMSIALKTTLETDGSGSRLYADAMANALAAHLISRYSSRQMSIKKCSGGLPEQKLRRVLAYIHEYLDQDLSLAELANLVQLSPYHFARLFKQSTGLAPHKYHLQCRIERAKQLLLAQDLSLAEVAYAVGFASQGHLNYHFKRSVGATPKQFLQMQ